MSHVRCRLARQMGDGAAGSAMICAHLERHTTGDSGTFGELNMPSIGLDGLRLQTGECPWRDNKPFVSCIPPGLYGCQWRESPRFGWTYEVVDVPDRTHIIIHIGNWCGDVDLSLRSDVEGCILLGMGSGVLAGQQAVLNSGNALTKLYAATKGEMLLLEITETWDNPKGSDGG